MWAGGRGGRGRCACYGRAAAGGDSLLFGPYLRHILPPRTIFGPLLGHKLRAERFILAAHYAARTIIFRNKFKPAYLYNGTVCKGLR